MSTYTHQVSQVWLLAAHKHPVLTNSCTPLLAVTIQTSSNVVVQLVLFLQHLGNKVHPKGTNVLCSYSLKNIELSNARDIVGCLEGLRGSPIDVRRKNVNQLVINPLPPLSLLPEKKRKMFFFLIQQGTSFKLQWKLLLVTLLNKG